MSVTNKVRMLHEIVNCVAINESESITKKLKKLGLLLSTRSHMKNTMRIVKAFISLETSSF